MLRRLLGVAVPLLLLAGAARPAELHVATGGSDAASGLSWSEALATLEEANRRALASAGPDTVRVAPGLYAGGVTLEVSVTLIGSVDPATGVSDPDRTPSVLDAQGAGPTVTCAPLADDALLEGFVITGGSNAGHGGGITCSSASPTIRNNRIAGNRTEKDGGGMSAADGSPLIEDNLFLANTAADDAGGLRLSRTAAVIRRNAFVSNVAFSDGGGVRLRDALSEVLIEHNVFRRNEAGGNGGGLSVVSSDVRLEGNTYESNQAGGEGGGGSYRDCPSVLASNDVALANSAASHGGGFAFRNSAGSLGGSLLRLNRAGNEGGGVRSRLGGPLTIEHGVFSYNEAGGNGGGVAIEGGVATLLSLLLARNSGVAGGGLMVDTVVDAATTPASVAGQALTLYKNDVGSGTGAGAHVGTLSGLTLLNAIVWANTGSIDLAGGGLIDVGFSDVEDPTAGAGVFSLDPLFAVDGPLVKAWTLDDVYLSDPLAGQAALSPCVDVGDRLAMALGLEAFTTRTDGVADAGNVDLGYHAPATAGFAGFDIYRSESTRLPGVLYLPGAAPGAIDPQPVLGDVTRPVLGYRVRAPSRLRLTKTIDSVALWF